MLSVEYQFSIVVVRVGSLGAKFAIRSANCHKIFDFFGNFVSSAREIPFDRNLYYLQEFFYSELLFVDLLFDQTSINGLKNRIDISRPMEVFVVAKFLLPLSKREEGVNKAVYQSF